VSTTPPPCVVLCCDCPDIIVWMTYWFSLRLMLMCDVDVYSLKEWWGNRKQTDGDRLNRIVFCLFGDVSPSLSLSFCLRFGCNLSWKIHRSQKCLHKKSLLLQRSRNVDPDTFLSFILFRSCLVHFLYFVYYYFLMLAVLCECLLLQLERQPRFFFSSLFFASLFFSMDLHNSAEGRRLDSLNANDFWSDS
jgi:hypothetical protein